MVGIVFSIILIIPVYNEEKNIFQTLQTIPDLVDEILIVNDGSQDNSILEIERCTDKRIKLFNHSKNEGKGRAIRTGLNHILSNSKYKEKLDTTIIVFFDGDGQMDPNLLIDMILPIKRGETNVVKGSRFMEKSFTHSMPKFRKIGNIILRYLNKISTGYWNITDPQSGFILFRGDLLVKLDLSNMDTGFYFENSFLHALMKTRQQVLEYPINAIYNVGENSSINYFNFITKTSYKLFYHWNYRIFTSMRLSVFRLLSLTFLMITYISIILQLTNLFTHSFNIYYTLLIIISLICLLITDFIDFKIIYSKEGVNNLG